jgi:hypothetical protein
MRFQRMSQFYLALSVLIGLVCSTPVKAAESSSLLSHSLADDYQQSLSVPSTSALSWHPQRDGDIRKNYDLNWSLAMKEMLYQDPFNKENLFVMMADLDMTYKLIPSLTVNLVPSFSYFNGYTQTQNEIEGNGSVWTMKNASLDFKPWSSSLLAIGALNQQKNTLDQDLHSAVLMDDRSFPAASFQLATPTSASGGFQLGLLGEAGVPTSASLTTQTDDQESTPSFQSAGAFLGFKGRRVKAELAADYFSFNNLPASVALQSGLLGNTVLTPNGQANSTDNTFSYHYRGLESFGRLQVVLANYWRAHLNGVVIANSGAPSGANQASLIETSVDWIAAHDIMLSPGYTYYRVESDAVVAAYNDSQFMPNMAGYLGFLTLQYRKSFRLSIAAGERNPLVENPNQYHEHLWNLKLELLNVAI